MENCKICGLPKKICVCAEIKKHNKVIDNKFNRKKHIEKLLEAIFGKYKDDFSYCELCGCFHYKNAHIKNFK